jgi:acyl-CoA thioesterase
MMWVGWLSGNLVLQAIRRLQLSGKFNQRVFFMQFSELLCGIRRDGGEAVWEVHPEWMQGRAVFGGLQAVLALRAMRGLVPEEVPLRTLQATFVAPSTSSHIEARAAVLREGKNVIQAEARLTDGENPLAVVTAVFGRPRPSGLHRMPVMPPVQSDHARAFQYIPGLVPAFIQHFTAMLLRGDFPFSGVKHPEMVVELGMPGESESSESHVIAMADFIPPIGLSWMDAPTPGSSMSWMLEILADRVDGLPMEGWRVDAEMTAADNGYTHQSLILWGPQGQAIALGRQTMVVFG